MAVRSAAFAVAAILIWGAAPGWAVQAHANRTHANVQTGELHKPGATQRTVASQAKPQPRKLHRRSIVGVGPQVDSVQRIRDLPMAPTG